MMRAVEELFERGSFERVVAPTAFDDFENRGRTINRFKSIFLVFGQIVSKLEWVDVSVGLESKRETLPDEHATHPNVRSRIVSAMS